MLNPCANSRVFPLRQIRRDGLVVHLLLRVIGRQDDDEVGFLRRLGRRQHAQPVLLGHGAALRAFGQVRCARPRRNRAATARARGPGAVANDRDAAAGQA